MLEVQTGVRRAGLPSRGSREALDRAAGNTRELIEETAIALFYEHGSQVTGVRDITKACGMTPGALYKHFPSKEDLLFEVIRSSHEHFLGQLDAALAITRTTTPATRLAALVRVLVLFHTTHRREARVGNHEYRFLPPPQQQQILELRRAIRARFHEVLDDGIRTETMRLPEAPGADAAGIAAVSILDMGMRVSEWFEEDRPPTAEDLADLHVVYVLRLVCAAP